MALTAEVIQANGCLATTHLALGEGRKPTPVAQSKSTCLIVKLPPFWAIFVIALEGALSFFVSLLDN